MIESTTTIREWRIEWTATLDRWLAPFNCHIVNSTIGPWLEWGDKGGRVHLQPQRTIEDVMSMAQTIHSASQITNTPNNTP